MKGKRSIDPRDYFPGEPRRDGRYQKKIRGRFYYFGGPGLSREEAVAEYQRVRDSLYAGRPAIIADNAPGEYAALTLRDAINAYLNARKAEVEAGALKRVTYVDLRACLLSFALHVGHHRHFSELSPGVFTKAALHYRKTLSACRFNHIVSAVNAWLNYADEFDWITAAPKTGPKWHKLKTEAPDRVITAEEFRKLLRHANDQWRAMLLLSLNCGMGPNDIADLKLSHISGDILFNKRPKTGETRMAVLWPETLEAIADWMTLRSSPLPELFITKYGRAWEAHDVGHEFKDLRTRAGVDLGANRGIYVLRHTFSTIADELEMPNTKKLILGQKFAGMDATYVSRTRRNPAKLREVVEYVAKHFRPFPQSDPLARPDPESGSSATAARS